MTTATTTVDLATRVDRVREAAQRIRLNALAMGEVQGQGYVGQALGAADMLAAVYADQLRFRADDPHWEERDRFLLSTGHYAIGLYAALAEAGIIPLEELDTYGSDDSRLPMSGMASYTPGMEISGGSLGHGLTVAVGMALGLRHLPERVPDHQLPLRWRAERRLHLGSRDGRGIPPARKSDRTRRHERPPGRRAHRRSPRHRTRRRQVGIVRLAHPPVNGNDPEALLRAFDAIGDSGPVGAPHVLVCDTKVGASCRCSRRARSRISCASKSTSGPSAVAADRGFDQDAAAAAEGAAS